MSRLAMGFTQPPVWVPVFFPGGTWPVHEVNHLPPSTAKFKNEWSCTSSSHMCLHSLDRENFTFLH